MRMNSGLAKYTNAWSGSTAGNTGSLLFTYLSSANAVARKSPKRGRDKARRASPLDCSMATSNCSRRIEYAEGRRVFRRRRRRLSSCASSRADPMIAGVTIPYGTLAPTPEILPAARFQAGPGVHHSPSALRAGPGAVAPPLLAYGARGHATAQRCRRGSPGPPFLRVVVPRVVVHSADQLGELEPLTAPDGFAQRFVDALALRPVATDSQGLVQELGIDREVRPLARSRRS